MVRWYHAIFSAYGYWLPNDPRGSWSDFVHSYELFRYGGAATTVDGKRSYAHDPHDAQARRAMKLHLKYPPLRFDPACRISVAKGFAFACAEYDFRIHACAIGFDHVHIVTSRDSARSIEDVVAVLKAKATTQMKLDDTHPMKPFMARYARRNKSLPTPWSSGRWSVFINDASQLMSAIRYVERHPVKEGLARQDWDFITKIDDSPV